MLRRIGETVVTHHISQYGGIDTDLANPKLSYSRAAALDVNT